MDLLTLGKGPLIDASLKQFPIDFGADGEVIGLQSCEDDKGFAKQPLLTYGGDLLEIRFGRELGAFELLWVFGEVMRLRRLGFLEGFDGSFWRGGSVRDGGER